MRNDMGRYKEAEVAYIEALTLQKRLATEFPNRHDFQHDLAFSQINLGMLWRAMGRRKEAEASFQETNAILQPLATKHPNVIDYQIDLGHSCSEFGQLLRDTGRAEASLKWFAQAIAVLQKVAQTHPNHTRARQSLRNSYWGRAEAFDMLGRHSEAYSDWKRTLELSPARDQRFFQITFAYPPARIGQVEQAIATVNQLIQQPGWGPNQWCAFACIYALAASKDRANAAKYANQAMTALQQAMKAGHKNVAHLKKNPDLDSLRQREDFQKLLADLEVQSKKTQYVH